MARRHDVVALLRRGVDLPEPPSKGPAHRRQDVRLGGESDPNTSSPERNGPHRQERHVVRDVGTQELAKETVTQRIERRRRDPRLFSQAVEPPLQRASASFDQPVGEQQQRPVGWKLQGRLDVRIRTRGRSQRRRQRLFDVSGRPVWRDQQRRWMPGVGERHDRGLGVDHQVDQRGDLGYRPQPGRLGGRHPRARWAARRRR